LRKCLAANVKADSNFPTTHPAGLLILITWYPDIRQKEIKKNTTINIRITDFAAEVQNVCLPEN
jgi:hypothetical protein